MDGKKGFCFGSKSAFSIELKPDLAVLPVLEFTLSAFVSLNSPLCRNH
jgi:hypothetical protein